MDIASSYNIYYRQTIRWMEKMSQEDNENLTYENESRLSRCSHCERLAEENSNLKNLIKHLKKQVRDLKAYAKDMYKYP